MQGCINPPKHPVASKNREIIALHIKKEYAYAKGHENPIFRSE